MLTPQNRHKTGVIFLFLLMFFPVHPTAACKIYSAGARSVALSHATIAISDVWSAFHNQAGLANLSAITSGLFFESRFGIRELALKAGTVAIPIDQGTFGISFSQFGTREFSEYKSGLAFAKKLHHRWSAAIQLDYLMQTLPETGKISGVATCEVGILFHTDSNLSLGVHLFNPVSASLRATSGPIKIPVIGRAGALYRFEEWLLIAFEVAKEEWLPAIVKTGIEFLPSAPLVLRLGVSGNPLNYTTGFGYRNKDISADLGFSYHGNLGITPSLSVQLTL